MEIETPMTDPKVIVLTGVSRGLGRAMLEQFIERGHLLFGCARSSKAVDELTSVYGTPHDFQCVDVSVDREVKQWFEHVLGQTHAPDLVINNAALINQSTLLWNVPPEEFSTLIDVNIKGVYHVVRHFIPAMIDRGTGVVVNFSSGWGRTVSPKVAPYCASKWAIEGLTQALAVELPKGLAAIPLNPGIINTEMLRSCLDSFAAAYPSPQDWARKAVPFMLELSADDNGRSLTVPS